MTTNRIQWKCPDCQKSYLVPDTQGLTVCPSCKAAIGAAIAPHAAATNKTPKRQILPLMIVAGLMSTTFIGVFIGRATGPGQSVLPVALDPILPPTLRSDPDKAKVAKWLKENLDDPHFEEVQWWPVRDLGPYCDEHRKLAEKDMDNFLLEIKNLKLRNDADAAGRLLNLKFDVEMWQGFLDRNARLSKRRICGMKFRTANKLGAKVIEERLFDVTGEVAKPILYDPQGAQSYGHDPDELSVNGWQLLLGEPDQPWQGG